MNFRQPWQLGVRFKGYIFVYLGGYMRFALTIITLIFMNLLYANEGIYFYPTTSLSKKTKSSEKLGNFTVDKVVKKGSPKVLQKGNEKQQKKWTNYLLENLRSSHGKNDVVVWFKDGFKISENSLNDVILISSAVIAVKSKFNFAILSLKINNSTSEFRGTFPIYAIGVIKLNKNSMPIKLLNLFVGMESVGESRRVLSVRYLTDTNNDKWPEVVISDERYAGKFTIIVSIKENNSTVKSLHTDAWD